MHQIQPSNKNKYFFLTLEMSRAYTDMVEEDVDWPPRKPEVHLEWKKRCREGSKSTPFPPLLLACASYCKKAKNGEIEDDLSKNTTLFPTYLIIKNKSFNIY
jgi:hypothetical protein